MAFLLIVPGTDTLFMFFLLYNACFQILRFQQNKPEHCWITERIHYPLKSYSLLCGFLINVFFCISSVVLILFLPQGKLVFLDFVISDHTMLTAPTSNSF